MSVTLVYCILSVCLYVSHLLKRLSISLNFFHHLIFLVFSDQTLWGKIITGSAKVAEGIVYQQFTIFNRYLSMFRKEYIWTTETCHQWWFMAILSVCQCVALVYYVKMTKHIVKHCTWVTLNGHISQKRCMISTALACSAMLLIVILSLSITYRVAQ